MNPATKIWKHGRAFALAVILLAASAPAASAYPVGFSGSGTPGSTGADAFGQGWTIGTDSWGIPGLGLGTEGFLGPDSALDFHIRFFDLPRGIVIDPTPAGAYDGFETTTRFSNVTNTSLWTRVIDADGVTVHFFATPGSSLENGEAFFVNVHFTGALSPTEPISFAARWTGESRAVPEPATLLMFGAGLSGLAVRYRRRKP
jgi:hypothetical protein